ncbi:MAG: hypothetical protein ACLQPD_35730 [Desulfomonilaceae bacterium]
MKKISRKEREEIRAFNEKYREIYMKKRLYVWGGGGQDWYPDEGISISEDYEGEWEKFNSKKAAEKTE